MSILVDTIFSPTYTPWQQLLFSHAAATSISVTKVLYTREERQRRDRSIWTPVQGILAPLQLVICLISLYLVVRYFTHGVGADIAGISVVVKCLILYIIMITGCLWEREVFGCYLFAPAFFWEDAVSMVVIALHTLYLVVYFTQPNNVSLHLHIALLAYVAYFVNAAQFVYKFRLARLSSQVMS